MKSCVRTNELILVRAIEFQGKRIGSTNNPTCPKRTAYALPRIVAAVLLVSLLAAFLFSSILQKATAIPIAQLVETARIVSREKKYSIRAPATSNADEIAVLIEAFNEMLRQIQTRDTALQARGTISNPEWFAEPLNWSPSTGSWNRSPTQSRTTYALLSGTYRALRTP